MPWLYKAPKFVKPTTRKPAAGSRVDVISSRLTYDQNTKVATATGEVVLTYGPYTLTATKVVYNMKTGHFSANGSVVLREPNGNVMQAEYSELYNKFKEGFARHVTALLTNEVTITGDYAKRYADGNVIYTRASYSACKNCLTSGGTPIWQIRAREAKHDLEEHTIYYKDMTFDIADVPVFWLPRFAYPDPTVTRRTGLLQPQLFSKSDYGFGMDTPFFWATSPSTDLTLTPRWTTGQGVLGQAEWRQRFDNGQYSIKGYGIYQMNPSQTDESDRLRGAITSKGHFQLDPVWSAGWNGIWQSDRHFMDNYSLDSSSLFTSEAHVTGLYDRSYLNIEAVHYDTSISPMIKGKVRNREDQRFLPTAAPHITAEHTFAEAVLGGEVSAKFDAYSLHRDDPVMWADTKTDLGTDQNQMVGELRWQRQIINGLGQIITPFTSVRGDVYVTYNVPGRHSGPETTADILPTAGVDMRWPLITSGQGGQSVLTPVAQIISSPLKMQNRSRFGNENSKALNFDSSNLFLDDRSSGTDSYESGTRANLGFVYNYLFNDGGFVRLTAGYSQHIAGYNTYQRGSGLHTPGSDFVAGAAYSPSDWLRLTYEARVRPNLSDIDMQEASAGLTLDRFVTQLGYADVAPAADYGLPERERQVWGDAAFRLSHAWSVFGGLRYDLARDIFAEKSIGIIYDCDCMRAKLTYTDRVGQTYGSSSEKTIMLSIQFRTIGEYTGNFRL